MFVPNVKIGRKWLAVFAILYALNIVVLVLASDVNRFLDFFFMADLFPFGLSIATLVFLSVGFSLDVTMKDPPFTSRPPFVIVLLSILSILWLASNAFSTSRWRFVPLQCNSIPEEFGDQREWCRSLQALKAFVWMEWVALFLTTVLTVRHVVMQHIQGNKDIWKAPLSRYSPVSKGGMHRRGSSFFTGFRGDNFSIRESFGGRDGFVNLNRGY